MRDLQAAMVSIFLFNLLIGMRAPEKQSAQILLTCAICVLSEPTLIPQLFHLPHLILSSPFEPFPKNEKGSTYDGAFSISLI
ncbi:hypothetical protein FKX85_03355 [Echinicola soli]|uniref:Uncharacterized protein n=1 Tax=Echinicola soli TaxID=2591634 RepID=A0A514CEP4_9BACT|nr:hypothetical protein [Echinicola soli]QDH78124.1 hypothetical protein FKX85_03355 [Echinicola soli]